MGFGLGGVKLGIKETRKHVEGTLINPETTMEGISSKNGVDKRAINRAFPQGEPFLPTPDSLQKEQDFEALLGRSLLKSRNELKSIDEQIMNNSKKYEHGIFWGQGGAGHFSTHSREKVEGGGIQLSDGDGETKSASESLEFTKNALDKANKLNAFDYIGEDNILHLFVNNNGVVNHYQAQCKAAANGTNEPFKYKLVNSIPMSEDDMKSRIKALIDNQKYIKGYSVYAD